MHLTNEVLDHLFGDFEVGDHTVAERTDSFDIAGRPPKHHFRFVADGKNLLAAFDVCDRHHGRLVQHDSPTFDINQGIRGTQIDSHVCGQNTK